MRNAKGPKDRNSDKDKGKDREGEDTNMRNV